MLTLSNSVMRIGLHAEHVLGPARSALGLGTITSLWSTVATMKSRPLNPAMRMTPAYLPATAVKFTTHCRDGPVLVAPLLLI